MLLMATVAYNRCCYELPTHASDMHVIICNVQLRSTCVIDFVNDIWVHVHGFCVRINIQLLYYQT